jgi:anaerobic magnesium-protoporphyrin IX monomethyl ester cyclase
MSKNTVLFLNPPNAPFTSRGILIEPIDTLGLASWVEHLGYDCSIIDMDVRQLLASQLDDVMNGQWPDVIVIVFDYHIPLHDAGTNEQIEAICDLARSKGSKIILGGKAATFLTSEKLKIKADVYIAHEMELALQELLTIPVQSWHSQSFKTIAGIRYWEDDTFSTLCQTTKREQKIVLDDLPVANRNLIRLNDYIDVRTLLSSRGCNLQCTFCHVPGFWGWWRGRSAQIVVNEIEHLVNHHHVKKILFLDDNAMVKPQRMEEISHLLQQRNISVALGCLGTIERYRQQTVEKMYQGGFRWIHYGVESGDNGQLHMMGKRINQEKIWQAVKGTQQAGLRVRTSWIMDMPEMTIEALKNTEEMILSLGSEEVRLHFLTLRLGSILHEQYHDIDTPQFIHKGQQNLNISALPEALIEQSVHRILQGLVKQGYTIVRNAQEFCDVQALKSRSPELKIVSLCPLRYGLGWTDSDFNLSSFSVLSDLS